MIHIYIKKCPHCDLYYFGRTTKDPYKYKGSGKKWLNHLKYHKITSIETIDVKTFNTITEAKEYSLKFSYEHNIVDDPKWANLIPENAEHINTKGIELPQEVKDKISKANKGKIQSEEHKRKNRESHLGDKNHFYGKTHTPETIEKIKKANIGRIQSEEQKKNHSDLMKGVSYEELLGKEKAEDLKKQRSNWITHNNPSKGKPCPEYTKQRIRECNAGKIWITDGTQNKRINKDDIIPITWKKGKTHKNKKIS